MNVTHTAGALPTVMSRPQVGIERLPARRLSNEPRESMNCKSCRKRKIKCNRLRPSCEACQVFQCPCVYDAVPKKRGPKTDVLEALLKRVDGLEAQLKAKKKSTGDSPTTEQAAAPKAEGVDNSIKPAVPRLSLPYSEDNAEPRPKRAALDSPGGADAGSDSIIYSPTMANEPSHSAQLDALLDTYFTRFHAKPYYILDESSVRQRLQLNQLPPYLVHAIYAVAARYTPHPLGYRSALSLSESFATMSRKGIDTDEPTIDALQALLLLVIAYIAAGKGKKAYMLLANAIAMATALELHREADPNAPVTPLERETKRRLFWSCYLLDRFLACGSRRPCLIGDKTIFLRLPCWFPTLGGLPVEGEFFQSGSNMQSLQGGYRKFQGSSAMLIDISRILGVTNRYLAAGGVKGDSHFPWHALSSLSKIRQDLDIWASSTEDVFTSLDALFGHPECTVLVLGKLIYHLIYCLIYRPFLPIDLAELSVSGQHQSWQIEATNMCFLHANAITELVELGKQTGSMEWPAFVGYCICTAGTVHIHGAHYNRGGVRGGEMGAFAASAGFLSREMQQLSELRYVWASVQHQRETLQSVFDAHAELVKHMAHHSMRYSPAFNLEDFFSRYANVNGAAGEPYTFDAANLSLTDVVVDFATDTYTGHDLYAPRSDGEIDRANLKRKFPDNLGLGRSELGGVQRIGGPMSGVSPSVVGASNVFSFSSEGSAGTERPAPADPAANPMSMKPPTYPTAPTPERPQVVSFQVDDSSTPRSFVSPAQGTAGKGESAANDIDLSTYDPMFGTAPTNSFPSPSPWHTEEGQGEGAVISTASGAKSPGESTATGTVEEKDPFLSLLEQLAENEHATGQGNQLDFFLTLSQS
ncbi:hypothetical protein GGS20DRAFT_174910 [Poronia punctata]|nr:hypothetical protein GGS20DRAFT_174910 [Poronia punctata]